MEDGFRPVRKQSLSDRLSRRIRALIQAGEYREGDRLPAIMEMARRFRVGHPTVREALKKLQTMGIVEIRHGSGVYVTRGHDVLIVASPDYAGTVTRKLLLDLIHARIPLEVLAASEAVMHATEEHLAEMRRSLEAAGHDPDNETRLGTADHVFHHQIAIASGNTILAQLLDTLQELFVEEYQLIMSIYGSRDREHREHLGILEALEQSNRRLVTRRMREHLEQIQEALSRWDPERHPVS